MAKLDRDIAKFINRAKEIPAAEQLALMNDVNARFGQPALELSRRQHKVAARLVEEHATWRLVPALLPPAVTGRQALVTPQTRRVPKLMGVYARLWTPTEGSKDTEVDQWGDLWAGKDKVYKSDRLLQAKPDAGHDYPEPMVRPYRLLYKTPDGKMVNRPNYLQALQTSGRGLATEAGVMTLLLMDVSARVPQSEWHSPETYYDELDPVISPEAGLRLQTLHIMAGRPMHPDVVNVVNEAVAELHSNGHVRRLVGMVGITQNSEAKFIRQIWHSPQPLPDLQPTPGISALQL